MGKKIFVSYKYADNCVQNLNWASDSTVRDYVDEFEKALDYSDDIFKGESDGEDLSSLSENQIWEILKNRIYDSTVTVIFVSPKMKEENVTDKEQWIPWEISYSLKEESRKNKNGDSVISHSNAMVAVVLPDQDGKYDYYFEPRYCCDNGCVTNHTENLFQIVKDNMFNSKYGNSRVCNNSKTIWYGDHSYIAAVKWSSFKDDYNRFINDAIERQEKIDDYIITKEIE